MDALGIEAFLAVVRHGSLTDAATSLFLSQSTLSHRLTQLENSIGMSLVDRKRGVKSLSLTTGGEDFLKIARKWEDLIQEMKLIRNRKKHTLAIGAVDSVHTYILPPVYKCLIQHSDSIDLKLETHQGVELYALLEQGELDVAFALFEKPSPNLIIKKLYSEPMVVIRKEDPLTPPYTAANVIPLESCDMSKQLYIDWNPSFRIWYDRCRGEKDFSGIRVDSAGLLLTCMDTVGKWAIVPLCIAQHFIKLGSFSLHRLQDPPPERVCYQIRPRYPKASAVESLQIFDSYLSLVQPYPKITELQHL